MLNWIWFLLLGGGIIYGALSGNMEAVSTASLAAAADTVRLIIEITGLLCLWLGMLKIAEESGLIQALARLLSPMVAFLFPDVPKQHPAFASMLMNMAANLLGLGNAATPFGLKAMEQLQSLNEHPDTASTPMITFLAINTSSITLVPTLVISLRAAAGSANPTEIIGAT
ncbi:MAG: nucleoside recognition domain-containing protein, partial [Clostridiales bacterium]